MNVLLYIAIVIGLNHSVTTYESSTKFTKIRPMTCGTVRLSMGWVAQSRSSCAADCMARYPEGCKSFMYNSSTKLCTPAAGLSSSQPPPSLSEGDLYYHFSPEFSMFTTGSSTVNLAYFPYALTYTDAESACKCLEAHLYAPDNLDKIQIIGNVAIPRYYMWIGLDDIAEEGTFVWAKNGQEIDASYKTAVFKYAQPDNGYGGGGEDCVFVTPDSYEFYDGACSEPKAYICEKPTLNNSI